MSLPAKAYWDIEVPFLLDFFFFSSELKHVRAANYDHLFKDADERNKRAGLIGVTDIYYQTVESLLAICHALNCRFPVNSETLLCL